MSEFLIEQGPDKDIVEIEGLNKFIIELRRIRNNINQIAYLANCGRIYIVDLSNVKQELGQIGSAITDLWYKG